ncbi:ABC transporter substrate-binding protein [Bowmanella denitrificans]|uniref:ABC transporter substrate-binding protein n=1 Tax=Bowmanella denitrificans TaxID=366582 RepID=A0ABP3H5Y1_9ALTE
MKCAWTFLFLLSGQLWATPTLVIYTQDLEPYHFIQDGRPGGMNYQLISQALDDEGIQYRMEKINWARAVVLVNKTPNTALLTLPRNIHRENQFKWVGPLVSSQPYFYRLRQRQDIDVRTLNDAIKLRIAVVRNGEWHQRLLALGMQEGELLYPVARISDTYSMVFMERVELIPGSDLTMPYMARDAGYDAEQLEPAMALPRRSTGNHLALNPDASDELVERLNKRVELLKAEGLIQQLKRQYALLVD